MRNHGAPINKDFAASKRQSQEFQDVRFIVSGIAKMKTAKATAAMAERKRNAAR